MAGGTLPVSSSLDETVAMLDDLSHRQRVNQNEWLGRLREHVAERPVVEDSDGETPPPPRSRQERAGRSGADRPDPRPFVALPRRTTHGGDFGPVVAEKIRNEIFARRGW